MIREALIEKRALMDGDFRARGPEVSRVEGFSDAAFAFGLTLLVISLEVPRTFDQLLDVMRGVPAFAVCFALLMWIWVAHYKFFRRYGLEDRVTIALNALLLFVVLLYIYPLKFVFTIFMGMLTGIQPSGTAPVDVGQVGSMFVIYGVGFTALFLVLALLNLRAYSLRRRLALDPIEELMTRAEMLRCSSLAAIGSLSVTAALLLPAQLAGMAGMVYALIALVEFTIGWVYGKRRAELRKSLVSGSGAAHAARATMTTAGEGRGGAG